MGLGSIGSRHGNIMTKIDADFIGIDVPILHQHLQIKIRHDFASEIDYQRVVVTSSPAGVAILVHETKIGFLAQLGKRQSGDLEERGVIELCFKLEDIARREQEAAIRDQLCSQLQTLQAQQAADAMRLAALHDEVERLASVLLGDSQLEQKSHSPRTTQAA